MEQESKKEQIVRKIRNSDKPALSASDLAEQLDVSVRTVNNHIPNLVEDERIETTQIGNATAYYIPFEDLPSHKKPRHTCKRCGRTTSLYDFAKVEHDIYFEYGNIGSGSANFSLLCRFCYSDYISWVNNDTATMGNYPHVHRWNIPEKQLREVRDNPDIDTHPAVDNLNRQNRELYELVKEFGGDEAVPVEKIRTEASEVGLSPNTVEPLLDNLVQQGHLFRTMKGMEIAYIAAK